MILNKPHTSPLQLNVRLHPLTASQMHPKQMSVTGFGSTGSFALAKQDIEEVKTSELLVHARKEETEKKQTKETI